jgi:hypothetical protein
MKKAIPDTEERVEANTAEEINERIGRDIEARVGFYAERRNLIEKRLDEIDREWDIERTLEMNAAAISVLGILLGTTKSRKWFMLPAVVGSFLMQHAIQGWCPPVPLFRRLGIRTTREINREKYALKALRGDFDDVNSQSDDRPGMKAETALKATKDKKAS